MENLGFDVCNTEVWTDETITKNADNQYIAFFRTNPFDVLNEIKEEISTLSVTSNTPLINDYFCTTTLNSVLQDGEDVKEALQDAQNNLSIDFVED